MVVGDQYARIAGGVQGCICIEGWSDEGFPGCVGQAPEIKKTASDCSEAVKFGRAVRTQSDWTIHAAMWDSSFSTRAMENAPMVEIENYSLEAGADETTLCTIKVKAGALPPDGSVPKVLIAKSAEGFKAQLRCDDGSHGPWVPLPLLSSRAD
jgi:hypothetical protein